MPKYEIYTQEATTYRKTYEAKHKGDAWNQYYEDRAVNSLLPIDTDEMYSEIEEIPEDA